MKTVAWVSEPIGRANHIVAEYQGLIAGLTLARDHGVRRIRVYMDNESLVDHVNGRSRVREATWIPLYEEACGLLSLFDARISWVPREWNAEAHGLVRDALATVEYPAARVGGGPITRTASDGGRNLSHPCRSKEGPLLAGTARPDCS